LSKALRSWGGKDGAIIVVSHDKAFCDSVGFNAVGTVSDGNLVLEQRDLNESDWKQYDIGARATGSDDTPDAPVERELTPEEKAEESKKRKQIFNAPKRIKKLEQMVAKSELKMGELVGKAKKMEEAKVAEMMAEWQELEALLAEVS